MPRQDTRTAILEAAEDLARREGLVRVTTKAVATSAGRSEASIYYHFKDRSDLLAEMVARRFTQLDADLAALRLPEGAPVADRLGALIQAVAEAYSQLIALSSPLLADPDVLSRFRAVLDEQSLSLHKMQETIADRLRQEQAAGSVRADVDPHAIALLIGGACHEIALAGHLGAGTAHPDPHAAAQKLAATLTTLLEHR